MNIIVVQSVRYDLIGYDRAIDHDHHRVIYIGTARQHGQVPAGLRCEKIERAESRPMIDEVGEIIERLGMPVDRLIAIVEEELLDAARLRARFGIPGPTLAQAEKVRYKTVMKRCVLEAGIRAPRYALLSDWLQGKRLAVADDAAVILKPIDGASSVNVERFDNQQVLTDALARRRTGIARLDEGTQQDHLRQANGFEVEEYVAGCVLHIDGIARQGRIEVMVPSRCVGSAMGFAHGEPYGSFQIDTEPALQQWVQRILAAVEIRDGAFHLEIIEGPHGPVFLEIAHRVGGARITESFERRTGVHLGVADVATVVDPAHMVTPDWDRNGYYGWFVVPAHHLSTPYAQVFGYEALLASGLVQTLNVLGTAKPVCKEITYVESALPLAGLLRAEDPQQLEDGMRRLFAGLRLRGLAEPVGIETVAA